MKRSVWIVQASGTLERYVSGSTRNKIAHTGHVPKAEKYFEITEQGAVEATEAAISILHWFADDSRYVVPKGFVKISDDGTYTLADASLSG